MKQETIKQLTRFILASILLTGILTGCGARNPVTGTGAMATAEERQAVIVPQTPNVDLSLFAGNIEVQSGSAGQVEAKLTKLSNALTMAAAQADLEHIVMTINQSGADVQITVGRTTDQPIGVSSSCTLVLTVPEGSMLDLLNNAGNVTVAAKVDAVSADLWAGNLEVRMATGDIKVTVGAGNASLWLPADAAFQFHGLVSAGQVNSDFADVPSSAGMGSPIDVVVGSDPVRMISVELGAGNLTLHKAN